MAEPPHSTPSPPELPDTIVPRRPLTEFEHLTLLAVLRLGEDAHGSTIRRELEESAHRPVAVATIYVALGRLEERGFVRSWRSDPRPIRGGKARKYYALEPAGVDALRETRDTLHRMWDGVTTLLDPAPP